MTPFRCTVLLASAAVLCAGVARAQAPDSADRLGQAAVSESLKVLKELDREVNRHSDSAALWHRRGMIAWTLWERSRHVPKVRGLDWTVLPRRADESLRRALDLEPLNETYFLSVARYLLATGASFTPFRGGYAVFDSEVRRAKESGDRARVALAAVQAARLYWLRYDALDCNGLRPPKSVEGRRGQHDPRVNYAGELEYLKTEFLLKEARDAAPYDSLIFRRYVIVLADHMRWQEVANVAREQIRGVPGDAWAWMSLGMASQRLGNSRAAVAMFDTALMRFSPEERKRLIRFERVLGTGDRARWDSLDASRREMTESFYWRNHDPIWSVEGTEPRVEFLTRLTFAELRWTAEELGLNGVNSDLGNTYIRTGSRLVVPSAALETGANVRGAGCVQRREAWYVAGDTTVLNGIPASWTRTLGGLRLDSIPIQFARFRGRGDSTDVVIAALPPIDAIRRAAQVTGPVRTDFWLLAGGTTEVAHDTIRPSRAGVRTFTHRLAPGAYVYRAEASADGARLAARGTAGFIAGNDARTGFATAGFGMSDILVATRAEPRSQTSRRWSDFEVVPLTDAVPLRADVTLIWENYEFGADSGTTKYGVTVTLTRVAAPPSPARGRGGAARPPDRIGANIISRVAAAIGIKRTQDEAEFTFQRTAPHAGVVVDYIQLSLRDTPAGYYRLTLKVSDQITGKAVGRSQQLVIVDPAARPGNR